MRFCLILFQVSLVKVVCKTNKLKNRKLHKVKLKKRKLHKVFIQKIAEVFNKSKCI